MRFIAGPVDHHRDIHRFNHLLYLRCVKDHGRFDGKITVFVHQHLIIRFTVFPCKFYFPVIHRFDCIFNIPSGSLGTCHCDIIQRIDRIKKCHCRCRRKINMIQRLLKDHVILLGSIRHILIFRDDQKFCIVFDIDHLIAVFVVIYLKTFGIFQIHRGFISESVNLRTFFFFGTFFRTAAFCFFCICCILFRLPASGQCCRPKQHCTHKNAPQTHRSLFHFLPLYPKKNLPSFL